MKNNPEETKQVKTTMTGIVVSANADKTVSVDVQRIFRHPVYKKIVRKKKKYLAHDEKNRCKPGDVVRIQLVRPISKRKRWMVLDILRTVHGKEDLVLEDEVIK